MVVCHVRRRTDELHTFLFVAAAGFIFTVRRGILAGVENEISCARDEKFTRRVRSSLRSMKKPQNYNWMQNSARLEMHFFRVTRPIKISKLTMKKKRSDERARQEFKSTASLELFISCCAMSSCFGATIKKKKKNWQKPKSAEIKERQKAAVKVDQSDLLWILVRFSRNRWKE